MTKKNDLKTQDLCYRNYVSDIQVRADETDENYAITDGYIVLFSESERPLPDSHNSIFTKGSFRKTIEERWTKTKKIQFLVNHKMNELPIGKILELREDNIGVYFKGEINLRTTEGRNVYELIKQGAISGMSFGFKIFSDYYDERGIQVINEVGLIEISPVTFPSQHLTTVEVQSVRSEHDIDLDIRRELSQQLEEIYMKDEETKETRSEEEAVNEENSEHVDDTETRGAVQTKYNKINANRQMDSVAYAFVDSLDEFIWNREHPAENLGQNLEVLEEMIEETKAILFEAYEFMVEVKNGKRSAYFEDKNKREFAEYLETQEIDGDKLLRTTPLTEKDLSALKRGAAYEVASNKVSELDQELSTLIVRARKDHAIGYKQQVKDFGTAERSMLATTEAYERQTSLRDAPEKSETQDKKVEFREEQAADNEAEAAYRSLAELESKLNKSNNKEE